MQPVIVWDEHEGTRTLHMMFWRFLPLFVTDPKDFKLSTINAKAETLTSNKMWQDSFLKRRCLIPADSFIEWRKDGKKRLPYVFAMKDDSPFALGGVWRHWRSPDRKHDRDTFAIITAEPNELVAEKTGHDRMPPDVLRDADTHDPTVPHRDAWVCFAVSGRCDRKLRERHRHQAAKLNAWLNRHFNVTPSKTDWGIREGAPLLFGGLIRKSGQNWYA